MCPDRIPPATGALVGPQPRRGSGTRPGVPHCDVRGGARPSVGAFVPRSREPRPTKLGRRRGSCGPKPLTEREGQSDDQHMETWTTRERAHDEAGGFESQDEQSDARPRGLLAEFLVTPVVAGLIWFAVYLYADSLKAGQRSWMNGASDGWALAPVGTVFIVVCGMVFALQLVLLLHALPDTVVGRWTELVIATFFGVTVSMTVFWYLGLSTLDDRPDGFPNDLVCILGLAVGGLVAVAIPVVAAVRRWRQHPPVGVPLPRRAQVRFGLVAVATILLVVLPTAANATATPALLVGLVLVPSLDVASRFLAPRR